MAFQFSSKRAELEFYMLPDELANYEKNKSKAKWRRDNIKSHLMFYYQTGGNPYDPHDPGNMIEDPWAMRTALIWIYMLSREHLKTQSFEEVRKKFGYQTESDFINERDSGRFYFLQLRHAQKFIQRWQTGAPVNENDDAAEELRQLLEDVGDSISYRRLGFQSEAEFKEVRDWLFPNIKSGPKMVSVSPKPKSSMSSRERLQRLSVYMSKKERGELLDGLRSKSAALTDLVQQAQQRMQIVAPLHQKARRLQAQNEALDQAIAAYDAQVASFATPAARRPPNPIFLEGDLEFILSYGKDGNFEDTEAERAEAESDFNEVRNFLNIAEIVLMAKKYEGYLTSADLNTVYGNVGNRGGMRTPRGRRLLTWYSNLPNVEKVARQIVEKGKRNKELVRAYTSWYNPLLKAQMDERMRIAREEGEEAERAYVLSRETFVVPEELREAHKVTERLIRDYERKDSPRGYREARPDESGVPPTNVGRMAMVDLVDDGNI